MSKGRKIEEESFDIISNNMNRTFNDRELPVVQRVIHSTGDFEFENILRFHEKAVESGIKAIQEGMDIFVDVKMITAGINKKGLENSGSLIHCYISDSDVEVMSGERDMTRAECAVDKVVSDKKTAAGIGIVAIGNAPTALLRVVELVKKGRFKPKLIIGVPVGFVKAEESKEMLHALDYPHITCLGKKGGSSIAVAILNALIKMA